MVVHLCARKHGSSNFLLELIFKLAEFLRFCIIYLVSSSLPFWWNPLPHSKQVPISYHIIRKYLCAKYHGIYVVCHQSEFCGEILMLKHDWRFFDILHTHRDGHSSELLCAVTAYSSGNVDLKEILTGNILSHSRLLTYLPKGFVTNITDVFSFISMCG